MEQGRIIRGVGGFYYVETEDGRVYECRARGIFRKNGIKPLVGDKVSFDIIDDGKRTGNVAEILPRRSVLSRPAAANADQALVLFSIDSPSPNLRLLDRFLISMKEQNVRTLAAVNKLDLDRNGLFPRLQESYRDSLCPLIGISVREGTGLDVLKEALKGRTTVLAGPSGVGKSSLTNALQTCVRMEVGEISRKLARGKNTTRHAQFIPLDGTTALIDSPGFTAFEISDIKKEELQNYYPEFRPYSGRCYFQGCAHMSEPGCAVKEAVESGKISAVRYRSYAALYEELLDLEKRRYK